MFTFPKRLLALTLFAALALAPCGVLRAQWVQTNGPPGGNITALATSDHSIFAATEGVFRSDDNGNTWIFVNTITGVNVLAANGTNIFAGTDAGVFRSTDNGISWDSILSLNVISMAVNGQSILACSPCTVEYSSDDGASWNVLSAQHQFGKLCSINLVAIIGNKLLVSKLPSVDSSDRYNPILYSGTIFISSNNGSTWDSVYNKPFYGTAAIGDKIFAESSNGFLLSTDSGWQPVNSWPKNITVSALALIGLELYAAAYGVGIYRSTDSGNSWFPTADSVLRGRDVHAIAADGQSIFASSDDGLFRSADNGTTWSELGIAHSSNYYFYNLTVVGSNLFAANDNGFFFSSDNGDYWSFAHAGLGEWSSEIISIGTNLIVGTNWGLERSSDDGMTWATVSKAITWGHFGVNSDALYAGYGSRFYRSNDSGMTWTLIDSTTVKPGIWIAALTVSGSNIFLGDETGFGSSNSGDIWRSNDGGMSWKHTSGIGLDLYWSGPYRLFTLGQYLYATDDFSTYRSVDSGETWTRVEDNINCYAIAGNKIFIGRTNGVFLSTDSGSHWTAVNSGLRDLSVWGLAVKGPYLFAGIFGSGVWRRDLWEMDPGVDANAFPLAAYPNPFSSSATIRYSISKITQVSIVIYDALGRVVATLASNEFKATGPHEIGFNTYGLPPDVYWCRMSFDEGERVLKLLVAPQ